jgi:hypothetical protein
VFVHLLVDLVCRLLCSIEAQQIASAVVTLAESLLVVVRQEIINPNNSLYRGQRRPLQGHLNRHRDGPSPGRVQTVHDLHQRASHTELSKLVRSACRPAARREDARGRTANWLRGRFQNWGPSRPPGRAGFRGLAAQARDPRRAAVGCAVNAGCMWAMNSVVY